MTGKTRPIASSLYFLTYLYFHNAIVKYRVISHFKSPLYHLSLLRQLCLLSRQNPTEWHENILFFNNKPNTMDFYIMIKDFFYSLSFSIITENVMVQNCLTLFFSLLLISTWMLVTLISVQDQSLILFFVLYNFKCIG